VEQSAFDHFFGHCYFKKVTLVESALDDLRWFGRKDGRLLLKAALDQLKNDPLSETRNLKTLRPNPVAQRELRLLGRYRILFNVDSEDEVVTIVIVGEKRGSSLIVQGEVYEAHHESDSAE
jgi:mRNA-degrading endonuclease RelE of RelBE toxin-antitoxin system